jgi:hypothetical protein
MPVVRVGELATPERRRQLGGVMTEVIDRDAGGKAYMKRHRVRIECMLDYYFNAYRINERQYTAGLKFREIYLRVNYDTNCKILCSPFLINTGRADPEGKIMAHMDCIRWLDEACKLLSSEQLTMVRKVCGYDEYAGTFANKKTLLRGLDILAAHWGYV